MPLLTFQQLLALLTLTFIPLFYRHSPASKSTKLWTLFFFSLGAFPDTSRAAFAHVSACATQNPIRATFVALSIVAPLKYLQRKLRFARLNALKMKYGFSDDPKTYENMTIEQAQEVERNMAEVREFPRLWQFGWISDFFRTSTDPGVSRAISSSGHFINEDKKIEHQRMQATVHLMTGLAAYPIKSRNSSLVISRINEHHHRYGIKINSDDVLYLIIHFGLAPVPWINKFGYRKLEPFEVHAIWVLWRELGCRMGLKYIPKSLDQALQWRKNFEETMRWRQDSNEIMAMAMLSQVLYPVPSFLKGFVAHVFASIVDWDIVYFCRERRKGVCLREMEKLTQIVELESLRPSAMTREIVYDIFRICGWSIREFGLPRLDAYRRSPEEPNKDGKMNFPHTPYDTMPWWQAGDFIPPPDTVDFADASDSTWNRWGPRALFYRMILGVPPPSKEFESYGVPFEAMGAPHKHPVTQSAIEQKVRDNAFVLQEAPIGYRPAIGFQANRLIPPVDGPEYGSEMNKFPEGTPTTPNNPIRFTREYERRGAGFSKLESVERLEDVVQQADISEIAQKKPSPTALLKINSISHAFQAAPLVSATA